jgi:hypothetical protein
MVGCSRHIAQAGWQAFVQNKASGRLAGSLPASFLATKQKRLRVLPITATADGFMIPVVIYNRLGILGAWHEQL